MKKLSLAILTLFIIVSASAQTPQALNYQAIARNSMGQIIPSQNIGVRFTITDATGNTTFYQETHSTTTNPYGLFTLAIGKGTAVSGAIAPIDWSAGGDKMLKVEIAPQGGTNYTIQGTTQLLSVPYALYAEKTKLVAGNAISITGGNTISANYIAGTGISITGNTISSTAALNSWLLNGNAGTTAANFLGTTDDTRLNFKTNNLTRMYIDKSIPGAGYDVGLVSVGDEANQVNRPGQLLVFGRDVAGVTGPMGLIGSTAGQTWGVAVGNTQGRLIRYMQTTTGLFNDGHFYDLGISQDSSLFFSQHLQQSGGPVPPRKMITISAQDHVGINLNLNEKPTADFHTKGTARFQNIPANNTFTRVMVMDANGNVAARDASTLGGGAGNAWLLSGNAGTTAADFMGTTDNQQLNFRVNNIPRISVSPSNIVGSNDISYISVGSQSALATQPANFSVYGKDISGSMFPVGISGYVGGMTWSPVGGANNTAGRLMRMAQWNNTTGPYNFYDIGIDQESDFFISGFGVSNIGGLFPRKMIQISNTSNVGINMDWADNPTANFHTKGTVRHEGITTNNAMTRILSMDANGNVFSRDASTLGGTGFWVADANGIHNSNTGHVGVGGQADNLFMLNVQMMEGTNDGRATARFLSNDTWQTNLRIDNSTADWAMSLVVGGSANNLPNIGVGAGNVGIVTGPTSTSTSSIPIIITNNNNVGISNTNGGTNNLPKSRLHVRDGDINIEQVGSGVIMKSPNGQCWRMTVSNAGTPVFTAITCP